MINLIIGIIEFLVFVSWEFYIIELDDSGVIAFISTVMLGLILLLFARSVLLFVESRKGRVDEKQGRRLQVMWIGLIAAQFFLYLVFIN